MGHFVAVDCTISWVTTTLTHWGQVYIDYGKGLLLVRFQAVTWNGYCHINKIRTQWVEDHSIHRMYIYSWNWFLIVLNTAIKDFEFLNFELNIYKILKCFLHITSLVLCEGNTAVIGGFSQQRPVKRSLGVFFSLRLNKRLSNKLRRRWFERPSRSLCRHCIFYSY